MTNDSADTRSMEQEERKSAAKEAAIGAGTPAVFTEPAFEALLRRLLGKREGEAVTLEEPGEIRSFFVWGPAGPEAELTMADGTTRSASLEEEVFAIASARAEAWMQRYESGQLSERDFEESFGCPFDGRAGLLRAFCGEARESLGPLRFSDLPLLRGCTSLSLTGLGLRELPPLGGLTALRSLTLSDFELADLSPLAALTGLRSLALSDNRLRDLSPLAALPQLTVLDLRDAGLSSAAPLAGLTGLQSLILAENEIRDVSPLAGLTKLAMLDLSCNRITDVSPLAGLTGLTELWLDGNEIGDFSPVEGLPKLKRLSRNA